MIQIFMYCEGVTDFEPICVFMRKSIPSVEIDIIQKTRNDLQKETSVLTKRRGIHKHITDIDRLAMVAKKSKCSHIAYHQDADGNSAGIYESIIGKFSEYAESYKCLAIVPKEMIESWLMADEQAYTSLFKFKPNKPTLPAKPEDVWGAKDDPDSDYPKHVIRRILGQYHLTPNRDTFAQIAELSNINTLKTRCPISFARFFAEMQVFLTTDVTAT